jgi:diadenylate cyclase
MIHSLRWQDILDIIVVAFIIYKSFLLIKGTRASQLVVGFIVVFLVFYISRRFELFTMGWILNNFVGSIILVIVVIFQNDIRRMLLALGRSPFLKRITYVEQTLFFDELTSACVILGSRKTGALIVLEREVGLEEFMEIGTRLDAEVNSELIVSIFQRQAPLHDGALIIREGRIRAGSCILPLTLKDDIAKNLGTRHRAAIGITEVSDALSLVVSEETGHISYAFKGEISTDVTADRLKKVLKELVG